MGFSGLRRRRCQFLAHHGVGFQNVRRDLHDYHGLVGIYPCGRSLAHFYLPLEPICY